MSDNWSKDAKYRLSICEAIDRQTTSIDNLCGGIDNLCGEVEDLKQIIALAVAASGNALKFRTDGQVEGARKAIVNLCKIAGVPMDSSIAAK